MKIINNKSFKRYEAEYFSVFYINFRELQHIGATEIFEAFSNYLIEHFNFNLQKEFNYVTT